MANTGTPADLFGATGGNQALLNITPNPLPTTNQTPQQAAQNIAGLTPTTVLDPTTSINLATGQTGLTPAEVNALLGYGNDVTAANTLATEDTQQQQEALAQEQEYGIQQKADQVSQQGYNLQAAGYGQEAGAYTTAAGISAENARLAIQSGNVQDFQTKMQIRQSEGAARAATGANGFGSGGSALALYSQSVRQGALQLAMQDVQTTMNANSFTEAQQAAAAEAAAVGVAQQGALTAGTEAAYAAEEAGVAGNEAGTAAGIDATNATNASAAGVAAQTNAANLVNEIAQAYAPVAGVGESNGTGGVPAMPGPINGLDPNTMTNLTLNRGPQSVTPGFGPAGIIGSSFGTPFQVGPAGGAPVDLAVGIKGGVGAS